MAARLPISSEPIASTISICCQSMASGSRPSTSRRMVMAKAASSGALPIMQRDRRRRALVDVGNPHVERRGAQLEGQAGDDEDQAEHQHLVLHLAGLTILNTVAMSSEPVAPYIIDRP